MVKKYITFMLIILIAAGCSYSVYSNSFPHLKRIQLLAFDNKSTEYTLGDLLVNNLSKSFNDDGRLRTVTQQPDCQLEGSILGFSEKIYSYDAANNVQDYTVSITFSLTFTDLVKNTVIYENKNLTLSENYAVSEDSAARFQTKDEAIQEIFSQLFKNIMQNTLETW